jgi:hypothetical protein
LGNKYLCIARQSFFSVNHRGIDARGRRSREGSDDLRLRGIGVLPAVVFLGGKRRGMTHGNQDTLQGNPSIQEVSAVGPCESVHGVLSGGCTVFSEKRPQGRGQKKNRAAIGKDCAAGNAKQTLGSPLIGLLASPPLEVLESGCPVARAYHVRSCLINQLPLLALFLRVRCCSDSSCISRQVESSVHLTNIKSRYTY